MAGWIMDHSTSCWMHEGHEECALKAAQGFFQARVAHDQGRARLYGSALTLEASTEEFREVAGLARADLVENHQRLRR